MAEETKHSHLFTLRNLDALSAGACVPIEPLAQAQVDFALNLLRHTGAPGSTIISPVSISIALAMAYRGAKAQTATQIRDVIAKGATEEEVHAHFAAVLDLISSNNLDVTLETANKLFVHQNFELLQDYVDGIKQHYKGQLEQVDFTKAAESAETINTFVEKATHDHIKDLISVDAINDLTRLILVNAIYFKGNWEKEFNADRTVEGDFYATPEKTTKKELMQTQDKFPYYESDGYQVLGLPYKNEKVYLYIILPTERYGLDDLVNNLNGATLAQLLSKRDTEKVNVKLPKFKIEGEFELTETLQKLGIVDAFNEADFSGITNGGGLFISSVVHKAFIETDEKGTKAAAATGAVMQLRCMPMHPPEPPKQFIADHGFLYVLTDAEHLHVLFAGKVAE
uniref:SERPIN domain-containing protein n=1 Tax=Panagrellus redivivus TaxID=6233 RepID=A0A7E4V4T0_PANRE